MAMAFNAQPGEQYTIRRKILKIFGAAFHVYDPQGKVIAYCKQKAFKLKEDIRLYTDDSCSTELLVIRARSIIDFSAAYDVTLPTGELVGTFRRQGLASTFVRDSWEVLGRRGETLATLMEESELWGALRRYVDFVALLVPQKFTLDRVGGMNGGTQIAQFRTHFNPFVYRLSMSVKADDAELDDLMILAAGCLIAAIEGRQE